LFLLDGYDEMAMKVDTPTRKNNFDTLAELANIPNNMVLLTGRPGYFPTLMEIAKTFGHEPPPIDPYERMDKRLGSKISGQLPVYEILQLNPFSPDQINSFLQKQSQRLKQEGVSDWNTLKQTIQSMPELQELSTRPVLLWMLVEGLPILLKEIKEVRDINLARVYQSFTNKWLIRDWDKGEVRRLVSTQERRDFMKALACEMHRTTGKHEIHHKDLKEKVRQWKGFKIEKEIDLEYIEHDIRTCTFLRHDDKDGYFRFVHKSFMEYFIAEELSERLKNGTCEEIQINDAIRSFIYSLLKGKWKPAPFSGPIPDWLEEQNGRYFCKSDGKEMVYVPPGPFIGEKENLKILNFKESFFIDRHPVTNSDYDRFIKAGGYNDKKYWSDEGWKYIKDNRYTDPRFWRNAEWNKQNYPVVGVSWYEADAYARWAKKQLPTEAMWEKAARGIDGRLYPWGDELPDVGRCNFGNKIGKTTPVNKYESGLSPYGAYDMAGNVWEWCEDWYDMPNVRRVLRGGCYRNDKVGIRSSWRGRGYPGARRNNVGGFRCARTVLL